MWKAPSLQQTPGHSGEKMEFLDMNNAAGQPPPDGVKLRKESQLEKKSPSNIQNWREAVRDLED